MDAERGLMQLVAGGTRARSATGPAYSPKLMVVARRLLGSRADAEDAVQRALLQCYGARGYQPRWAVSTWLYRILSNVCVDELRRRATRTAHEAPAAGPLAAEQRRPPDAYPRPARALARVPREARVLLALRYVDGLSYGELARIRGITIKR